MNILSNNTVKQIEEGLKYYNEQLEKYPEYSNMIKKDIEKCEAQLEEAKNRNYVGQDDKGALAYVDSDNVLWVEGKPSGWSYDSFKGKIKSSVVYDGGTKWTGVITFN